MLTVELIPVTCYYQNLRHVLEREDWDKLRRRTYRRAGYVCEVCRRSAQLHCHEKWEYSCADNKHVQRLVGLEALCSSCHEAVHMGIARLHGREARAMKRMAEINGWSMEQVKEHVFEATLDWLDRSVLNWELDISLARKELEECRT